MRATQALELLKMAKPESDREALLIIVATALDALGAPDLAWPLLREAAKTRKTL
jgi:hypothetical protein